eukprot:9551104-Alexandrium_andersonii.AAC.1
MHIGAPSEPPPKGCRAVGERALTDHRSELVAGHFGGWSKRARGPKSSPRGRRSQQAQRAKRPSPRLRIVE